ncbi:uncharacterized protein LOC112051008 isoform X7 [Bicyclus anynana]|uniref:Uncharacterized protein LOC112051008 isoform X7 n=1 Tax=Bicyclus anynana TaxID=110368 RepID=A0ABM3M4C8_BICAN|nr:uncharacterized protein LOC112051008 isoform X7 [Bicyclus anynana]
MVKPKPKRGRRAHKLYLKEVGRKMGHQNKKENHPLIKLLKVEQFPIASSSFICKADADDGIANLSMIAESSITEVQSIMKLPVNNPGHNQNSEYQENRTLPQEPQKLPQEPQTLPQKRIRRPNPYIQPQKPKNVRRTRSKRQTRQKKNSKPEKTQTLPQDPQNFPLEPQNFHRHQVTITSMRGLMKIEPTQATYIYPTVLNQATDMTDYLVFNDRRQETSPEGEPSTSTRYQTSRFVVEDEAENEEEEVEQIIIKEEVSEEEKNQCRLCLSVNRRMWELGENAPLYRKLLFETNQNSTMPSFIYEMLACWECHAELRKIRRFQDKVRRANSAFETSQNLNCQELSNLGTVLITEEQPSNSELQEDMIKQEPLDIEETAVPDPLDVNRAPKEEIIIEVPRRKFTPKTTKRTSTTKTSQNTPKRTKIDPNTQEDPQTDAPVDCDEIFCKVKIELEELQSILEGRRNKDSFKNMKYKCDSCVLGFTDYSRLQEHNASFHDEETGICSCDICERRFTDERLLATHTRNHFVKFVCRLCPFECYTKTGRMIHFRRHKEAVQSDDPDSVLRQKLSSMESTGESSHDLD